MQAKTQEIMGTVTGSVRVDSWSRPPIFFCATRSKEKGRSVGRESHPSGLRYVEERALTRVSTQNVFRCSINIGLGSFLPLILM